MKKLIFCTFGVHVRSQYYTFPNIQKNIIDVLSKKYEVTKVAFDIMVDNDKIDGNTPQHDPSKYIIKYDYYNEFPQSSIDNELKKIQSEVECKIWKIEKYNKSKIQNALRQMYIEYECGKYIETVANDYDKVIVCSSDYYIPFEINMVDVDKIQKKSNIIYFSRNNNCSGYTNGFYISTPAPISKLLKRYEHLDKILPIQKDYEYILKVIVDKEEIRAEFTDMIFFKIRNNNTIYWPGSAELRLNNIKSSNHEKEIISEYNKLTGNQYDKIKNVFSPCVDIQLYKYALYTIITGDYESCIKFTEPLKKISILSAAYLVTDSKKIKLEAESKGWEVIFLEKEENSKKQQRKLKVLQNFHPDLKILNDYDILIYCDGSQILHNITYLNTALQYIHNYDVVCFDHPHRTKSIDEANAVLNLNLVSQTAYTNILKIYEENKYPDNIGLSETRVLIRKTNERMRPFCEEWFTNMYNSNSFRDQTFFEFSMWKHKVNFFRMKYSEFPFKKGINHADPHNMRHNVS